MPNTRGKSGRPGIDVDGAMLSAIGFGALVFAVIEGPDLGWWTPKGEFSIFGWNWPTTAALSPVPVALGVAVIALALFVMWEHHREKVQRTALLRLGLFLLPTFAWGNVTAGMVAVGEFAIIFVLPLYLINALGLDIMGAGLVLAAMAVGAFLSGASARYLAARFGAPATVLIGLALEVIGILVLALLVSPTTPGWGIGLPLTVYGLGLGLASAQLTGTVLRDIPVQFSGQGSATQSTVRQIGSALGTAVAGAMLSVSLSMSLPQALEDVGLTGEVFDSVAEATRSSAGVMIAQLRAQGDRSSLGDQTALTVKALTKGLSDATSWALLAASLFLVIGFVGVLRLRRASMISSGDEAG